MRTRFILPILIILILIFLSCQTSVAKSYNATLTDIGGESFEVGNIMDSYHQHSIGIKLGEAVATIPFGKISKMVFDWDQKDQILTIFLKTGDPIKGIPEYTSDFSGEILNSIPFSIDSSKVAKIEFHDDSPPESPAEDSTGDDQSRDAQNSPGSGLAKSLGSPSNFTDKSNSEKENPSKIAEDKSK